MSQHDVKVNAYAMLVRGEHWRDEPVCCSVDETDRVRMFRDVYQILVHSRGRDSSRQ